LVSTQLDNSLLKLLFAIFSIGTELDAADDTLAVLRLLRQQRPAAPEVIVTEALQILQAGDAVAARLLLEEADSLHPGNAFVKASLALTLFGQRDSLWEAYVNEVKALPHDDQAMAIVAGIDKTLATQFDPIKDEEPEEPAEASTTTSYLPFPYAGVAC
jgi:thioredoxin-like negative regulator of GroEL